MVDERRREYRKMWYAQNRERHLANTRAYRKARPEQYAAYSRRRLYGLTAEQYKALELKQLGVCALCNMVPEKGFRVDHDHKTGEVRGLLCHKCNTAIGLLGDDPLMVHAALDYLKRSFS